LIVASPRSSRGRTGQHDVLSHSQRALREIYAGNRVLADAVTRLLDEQHSFREDLDDHQRQQQLIRDMEDDNVALQRTLLRQELVLHDFGLDAAGNPLFVDTSNEERTVCMMSMDPEPPTVSTKYLETKVGELSDENDRLEEKNGELQSELLALRNRLNRLQKSTLRTQEGKTQEAEIDADVNTEAAFNVRIANLEKALADAMAENTTLKSQLENTDFRKPRVATDGAGSRDTTASLEALDPHIDRSTRASGGGGDEEMYQSEAFFTTEQELKQNDSDDSSVDISVSLRTETSEKSQKPKNFDQIVRAVKEILGRDVPQEMLATLRLLSDFSDRSTSQPDSYRPPPIRIPSRTGRSRSSKARNVDDGDDEIKSVGSQRRVTSLNLSAVFRPQGGSELEKELKNLESLNKRQSSGTTGGRLPQRGVRKTKSGGGEVGATSLAAASNMRRTVSTFGRKDIERMNLRKEQDVTLAKVAAKSETDDLDLLFRHAVTEVEENSSHHRDEATGVAAFKGILLDTEATYGIEIPDDIGASLMAATLATVKDGEKMPLLLIVQCLHDDDVIKNAGIRAGKEIPADLVSAIRSTSLPAGVSVAALRPLDASSAVLSTKTKNSSEESIQNSSKHSVSGRPIRQQLPQPTKETLRRFEESATKKYNSSTESMAFSLMTTDSSRRSRSTSSTNRHASSSHSGSTSRARAPSHEGSSSSRGPPLDPRTGKALMDVSSSFSERSGKMRRASSSAHTRKKKKETKKYRKGTKDAMFERAQRRKEQFASLMLNLADFGASTNDLQSLVARGKLNVEGVNPGESFEKLYSLLAVERSHDSSAFLGDTVYGSITSAIPNPDGSDSCMTTSPQESELDMLFARFFEIAGRPLPVEIDLALRKASRSMDESLHMVSTYASLSNDRRFGTELSAEKLDFIYGEAEIFLGREIEMGILDTLVRAASDLLKLEEELSESVQKFSASYASILSMEFSVGRDFNHSSPFIASLPEMPREDEPSVVSSLADHEAARTATLASEATLDEATKGDLSVTAVGAGLVRVERVPQHRNLSNPAGNLDHMSNRLIGKVRARKPRSIPSLTDSEADFDYEEDYLNPVISSQDDSKDSGAIDRRKIADDVSAGSGRLSSQPEENESTVHGASASVTSEELNVEEVNAIISQAQDEYGIELSPELIAALKTGSTGSVNEAESQATSQFSLYFTQHAGTDIDESAELLELMKTLKRSITNSEDRSRSFLRAQWRMEEYLSALFAGAMARYGAFPDNLHDELWETFANACASKENSALTADEIYDVIVQFSEDTGYVLLRDFTDSFLKSARDLGRRVSLLSEVSYRSNETNEAHCLPIKHLPNEPGREKTTDLRFQKSLSTSSLRSSLQGARFSVTSSLELSSDLEISLSEGTTNTRNTPSTGDQKSDTSDPPFMRTISVTAVADEQENPNGVKPDENDQGVDEFISEVEKEYGLPLPSHVLHALRDISVRTGQSSSSDSSELFSTNPALSVLSAHLPQRIAGAIQRTVERRGSLSDLSMPPLRSFSSISALTGFTGATGYHSTESSDWTTEEERKENTEKDRGYRFAETSAHESSAHPNTQLPPPPPPPLSPPPPLLDDLESSTSGSLSSESRTLGNGSNASSGNHIGKSLLRSVKKIYERKIPKELAFVLTMSRALLLAKNTDEEIQIILAETEYMSGKRLPADLVLALREASVEIRASSSSTLRRTMLNRNTSGSIPSRSSGMPSIQEWEASTVSNIKAFEEYNPADIQVDRVPSSFGALSIPNEIAAEERSSMDVSTLKDSEDTDGTVATSFAVRSAKANMGGGRGVSKNSSDSAVRSSEEHKVSGQFGHRHQQEVNPEASADGKDSALDTRHSPVAIETSNAVSTFESEPWNLQSTSSFNSSAAVMLPSDTTPVAPRKKTQGGQNDDKMNQNKEHSSSLLSVFAESPRSSESSSSTEVTRNNSGGISMEAVSNVSRASSLTTSKLPRGIHTVLPLEGVETDDLSAIFKEAAKRFS